MHEPVGRAQFGVFEKFTSAHFLQIARENNMITYTNKESAREISNNASDVHATTANSRPGQIFQTNSWQFAFILPYRVNTHCLQESDWSKQLSSCLYFVACFCFWYYPLNFELRCCCFQEIKPVRYFAFLFLFFKATCQSFLISVCTNFVFLHSSLLNLGLTEMLSANQDAEIFVCML